MAAIIELHSLSLHLSAVYLELLCCQISVFKQDVIFFPLPFFPVLYLLSYSSI